MTMLHRARAGAAAVLAAALPLSLIWSAPAHAAPTLVKRSAGTVVAEHSDSSVESTSFALTGSISFGNRTCQGTASGGVFWYCCGEGIEPPIPLHGSSPDGDLDATCVDDVDLYMDDPGAGYLVCTGHIGDGTTATTRLVIALPITSGATDPHQGTNYGYSGVFAG